MVEVTNSVAIRNDQTIFDTFLFIKHQMKFLENTLMDVMSDVRTKKKTNSNDLEYIQRTVESIMNDLMALEQQLKIQQAKEQQHCKILRSLIKSTKETAYKANMEFVIDNLK